MELKCSYGADRKVFPKWKAELMISLFNGDGGDGFTDKEIQEANDEIVENGWINLTSATEMGEGRLVCSFLIIKYTI